MKYLKLFNESIDPHDDPEIKHHLNTIGDLFFDVVDEYDLYKDETVRNTGSSIYFIFHWEHFNRAKLYKDRPIIRLLVYDKRCYKIKQSNTYNNFKSRLQKIGYILEETFNKNDSGSICLDIDYSEV